jgi:hypothetical protein
MYLKDVPFDTKEMRDILWMKFYILTLSYWQYGKWYNFAEIMKYVALVGIRQLLKEDHRWQDYMHDYVAETDLIKISSHCCLFCYCDSDWFCFSSNQSSCFLIIGK